MMRRIILGLSFLFLASAAHAQLAPVPYSGSPAAGEGSHTFSGSTLVDIIVSWNAGTGARYFMVFDGPLPSNGATTACSVTQQASCLAWCAFVNTSTSAPGYYNPDFITHPLLTRNGTGITTALSTGAGCGTLTVDTGADWYYGATK